MTSGKYNTLGGGVGLVYIDTADRAGNLTVRKHEPLPSSHLSRLAGSLALRNIWAFAVLNVVYYYLRTLSGFLCNLSAHGLRPILFFVALLTPPLLETSLRSQRMHPSPDLPTLSTVETIFPG